LLEQKGGNPRNDAVLSRPMTVMVANCLIFGRAGRGGFLAPERNFFAPWLLI
jgi:hypothetical protein